MLHFRLDPLILSNNVSGFGSGMILCCTLLEYYAEVWEISKKGCYKGQELIGKDEK